MNDAQQTAVAALAVRVEIAMATHPQYPYPPTPITPELSKWAAMSLLAEKEQSERPANGFALFGGVGTGKTTAMRCLARICGFVFVPATALDRIFAQYGDAGLFEAMDNYAERVVCIDDLGTESAKNYGQAFPMTDLLSRRYDLWQEKGIVTHLTGNLDGEQRLARYGSRAIDRINQMCVTLPCSWPSFRKRATGIEENERSA